VVVCLGKSDYFNGFRDKFVRAPHNTNLPQPLKSTKMTETLFLFTLQQEGALTTL
jgi:hypothetical protein